MMYPCNFIKLDLAYNLQIDTAVDPDMQLDYARGREKRRILGVYKQN